MRTESDEDGRNANEAEARRTGRRRGGTLVEIGALVGLVALVAIGTVSSTGQKIVEIFGGTSNAIESGMAGTLSANGVNLAGGVAGQNAPPAITTASLGSATETVAYSQALAATTTPVGDAVSWSVSGQPGGLSISGATLSGTPSAAGTYSVIVTATDSVNGLASSATFSLVVAPPPTVLTCVGASSQTGSGTAHGNCSWPVGASAGSFSVTGAPISVSFSASGGGGATGTSTNSATSGAGSRVTGSFPAQVGTTYAVRVGGGGGAPASISSAGTGGIGGGGAGGVHANMIQSYGGGGGCSGIFTGSVTQANAVVVAGAGGGSSTWGPTAGNGGYPSGGAGATGIGSSAAGGGTASAGGAGSSLGGGQAGTGGALQGGWGWGPSAPGYASGGGGCGYWGGGGGNGGAPGGGSSWYNTGVVTGFSASTGAAGKSGNWQPGTDGDLSISW